MVSRGLPPSTFLLPLALLACGATCGTTVATQTSGTTSGAGGATGATGATGTTGNGGANSSSGTTSLVTGSTGSGAGGALTTTSSGIVDGGGPLGPFECASLGCLCDGATHYCKAFYAGKLLPGPPPLPNCEESPPDSAKGCIPLPADCLAAPSCATCFPGNGCPCTDTGLGIQVECYAP